LVGVLSGAALFAFSAELGSAIGFASGNVATGVGAGLFFNLFTTLLVEFWEVII